MKKPVFKNFDKISWYYLCYNSCPGKYKRKASKQITYNIIKNNYQE